MPLSTSANGGLKKVKKVSIKYKNDSINIGGKDPKKTMSNLFRGICARRGDKLHPDTAGSSEQCGQTWVLKLRDNLCYFKWKQKCHQIVTIFLYKRIQIDMNGYKEIEVKSKINSTG